MKPTLFDVMDDEFQFEAMTEDNYAGIGAVIKSLLNDLPGTFNHDSVSELKFAYRRLEVFIERLEEIAEPNIEGMAKKLAEGGYIDSLIDEGKE